MVDYNIGASGDAAALPAYPTASLYVGDLLPDVNEAMLFDKFSVLGRVLSIRVCRDMTSHRSLGYAYVNFGKPEDAERALDALNFVEIGGKPIRIMWSQRDPALRRSGVGNIFIKNLDAQIGIKDIYDTFSTFGTILSCKVATYPNGQSKGFGFVHFETQESAQKAIEKVNGMLLSERTLYVGHFISRRERQRAMAQQPKTFTNVYIKNFPADFDDAKLKEIFEPFGAITSCHVMLNKNGESRGFGFVNFADAANALKACETLNGHLIQDKVLYVGRAQKKAERLEKFQSLNIYIKNLEEAITDDEFKEEFGQFGEITSAKIMRTEEGRSRGFGFVCFTTPEEAQRAIGEMHSKIYRGKLLHVCLAQTKAQRLAQLASRFNQRSSETIITGINGLMKTSQPGQVFPSGSYYMPTMNQRQPTGFYPPSSALFNQTPPRWAPPMRQPYLHQL